MTALPSGPATGFDLGHLLVLAAATAVLTTAAVLLFDRRDVYVA